MKKITYVFIALLSIFVLSSCATYRVSKFYPKTDTTTSKLSYNLQIDDQSLKYALCRTVRVRDFSYYTILQNGKVTETEHTSIPLDGKVYYAYHYWDDLPLGEQEDTVTLEYSNNVNWNTGYNSNNQWQGSYNQNEYQKDITRKYEYEYVKTDVQDLKDIISKGLLPVIAGDNINPKDGTIRLSLSQGNIPGALPRAKYRSKNYTAASMLLSTLTLGASNILGVPVGTLRGNITINADLVDNSGTLIKHYCVNADGFGKLALYSGLHESHILQAIYADAVKNAVIKLAAEIKNDNEMTN